MGRWTRVTQKTTSPWGWTFHPDLIWFLGGVPHEFIPSVQNENEALILALAFQNWRRHDPPPPYCTIKVHPPLPLGAKPPEMHGHMVAPADVDGDAADPAPPQGSRADRAEAFAKALGITPA